MTAPSPFQVAQSVGNKLGQIPVNMADRSAIDEIMERASKTKNPADMQQIIADVVKRVSPDRRQAVLGAVTQKAQQLQSQQAKAQRSSQYEEMGFPPGLADLPDSIQAAYIKESMKNQGGMDRFNQLIGSIGTDPTMTGQGNIGPTIVDENLNVESIGGESPGPQPVNVDQTLKEASGKGIKSLSDETLIAMTTMPGYAEPAKQELKRRQSEQKLGKEQVESEILAKYQRGEKLTPEEQAKLSPTSLRTIIGQEKPTFEPTEERLEAERVSNLATEIENDYEAAQNENMRLGRMEKLSEKGDLSTPLMVKTLNTIGLPLGVLGNPDSEEYAKLEADFLRDVRKVFPGGRITNYEVQAYMKTVPSLMNSKEGRKAIIRNRKLMNEAKELRYKAYRDILKENKGIKPRNMGIEIQDRVRERMGDIEEEFIENIRGQTEKFQQPLRMLGPDGSAYDIPPDRVEQALTEGFKFK